MSNKYFLMCISFVGKSHLLFPLIVLFSSACWSANFPYAENKAPLVNDIAVTLLDVKVINAPPMIPIKDIETYTSIANTGKSNFEFSYLRAVYFGDDIPLSTYVYFNAHFENEEDRLKPTGLSFDEKASANSEYIDGAEEVPPEEQFTISGAFFEGDFKNEKMIQSFRSSHNFEIPVGEEFIISTESGRTLLGEQGRYQSRKFILDFLDSRGRSIHQAQVRID